MAKPKVYAITSLAAGDSVYLEVAGTRFDIAQFTASWAANEIPHAQAMLGIGRRSDDVAIRAAVHEKAKSLREMQKAVVYFTPQGEYDPEGKKWPAGKQVLFEGYFMGFGYQKIQGKVQMVANLTHWLMDLACSSCLSMNSHPGNPAQLTAAAVMRNFSTAGGSQGAFLSELTGQQVVMAKVLDDFWAGIKELFSKIASIDARPISPVSMCIGDGTGSFVQNSRALNALARIEGPCVVGATNKAYTYGVPLPINTLGVFSAQEAIGGAVCRATVDSYAYTTFWDKLVGDLLPSFHMAIVPMVSSAVIIADTPAYNASYWRAITPDEYDSFQMSVALERPLRAVGVMGGYGSLTGAQNATVPPDVSLVGGCFVAGSVDPDDGMVQYVRPPLWLEALTTASLAADSLSGASTLSTIKTAEFPGAAMVAAPGLVTINHMTGVANNLYGKYAHAVYVANMLRGRHGLLAGKLRFDIAPASCVRIVSATEKFIGGEDDLACDLFANVTRVTVAINCEAAIAATTYQLSHVRTEGENTQQRTSVAEHPLFGKSIHGSAARPKSHGCPLIAAYDL